MHEGKVLLLRESHRYEDGTNKGKFDVIGGRVTPGERYDSCLKREIHEETHLDVTIGSPFAVNEWRPVVKGEQWQVVGIFFECIAENDIVLLSTDHDEYVWIDPKAHAAYELIPGLEKLFEKYLEFKGL